MPLPYVSQHIIAQGAKTFVRIGNSASDAQNVAFVESFSISEDYQPQEARVLGQFMPISIDPQGYVCNVQFSGFIPSRAVYEKIRKGTAQLGYSLNKCLLSFLPDARDYMDSGQFTKIPYMDLVENLDNPSILYSLEGVIIGNVSVQVQTASYTKLNVTMRALVAEKGYR